MALRRNKFKVYISTLQLSREIAEPGGYKMSQAGPLAPCLPSQELVIGRENPGADVASY
jgi:hypothetical protein